MTKESPPGELRTRRRPLLRAMAGTAIGAGVTAGTGAVVMRALAPGGRGIPRGGRLVLEADRSGVGLLDSMVSDLGLTARGQARWRTPAIDTSPVSMVGFTWRPTAGVPRIHLRFRHESVWSPWLLAPLLHDVPDAGSGEGRGREGTAPIWVAAADGVQVGVAGVLPADLRLTLIHAPRLERDRRPAGAPRSSARVSVPAPTIYSRAAWGADESWRSGSPVYNHTIKQAHVHHTATPNGYAQADVPALIRSMYRYHTHSLGWSDIGYNFLVDIFGGIWEGRAGGIDRPVRGAHTLGFNDTSTGFSVIGNYDQVAPTNAVLDSLAATAAWKLAAYGRDPQGTISVRSRGSDKFASGRKVVLPVIDGHRDTNDTACPGANLYAQLPTIRMRTAGVIASQSLQLKTPFAVSGSDVVGQTLTVGGGTYTPADATVSYAWTRAGVAVPGATTSTYAVTEADVGQVLGVVVTLSREGATPVTQQIALAGPAMSPPTLTVRTQRRPGGKAIVHLEVAAPGVPAPAGQVIIKVGPRQRTVAVEKGTAIARFVGLPPGRYRVRCQYAGSAVVLPARARDWVRIPGK